MRLVEYWAGVELVPRPEGNVLSKVQAPSSEEKCLAKQSAWFQEFM